MRRVLALTLVCFVVLLLFVGVVIFVERSQTQVENLPELRPCQSGVCLFNIAPDETSITDAQATLKKIQTFTFSTYSDRIGFKQSQPSYRIDLIGASGRCSTTVSCVGEIDLVFPLSQNGLTAGQIITEFGPPCAIVPFFLPRRITLMYPGMVFFFMSDVQADAVRFQPTLQLGQINLFQNAAKCEEIVNRTNQYYPWQGFSVYQRNP